MSARSFPLSSAGELDQPGHGRPIHRDADLRRPLLDLARELRRWTESSALDPGRMLLEELRDPAPTVQRLVRHENESRGFDRPLDAFEQRLERLIGGLALARRRQDPLGLQDDDYPPGRHHRQRFDRVGNCARLQAGVAAVQPLDVERAQLRLDRVGEQPGQLRLEHLVRALDEIEPSNPPRRDVRTELLGREVRRRDGVGGHGGFCARWLERLQDRADDRLGELGRDALERVRFLAEERVRVRALVPGAASYSSRKTQRGLSHSTLFVFRSRNSSLATR